jgi:hypothetical protein
MGSAYPPYKSTKALRLMVSPSSTALARKFLAVFVVPAPLSAAASTQQSV